MPTLKEMTGVRDHNEDDTPELFMDDQAGRLVIRAFNEGRHNVTHVDLLDLIQWLQENMPELMHEKIKATP